MKGIRNYLTPNLFLLLLWILGFGFMFVFIPRYSDDYWYMCQLKPWFDMQGLSDPGEGGDIFRYGVPWKEIADTWRFHYENDNIRFVNIIFPLFGLLPKWVGSGLATLALLWSVCAGFRIAGIDWQKSALLAPVLFGLTFFMPWSNNFTAMNYQFNYILPTALGLALYLALAGRVEERARWQGRDVWLLLLGFLLGISHEGIGVPVAMGLLAVAPASRRWRIPVVALSAFSALAGSALIILFCPYMSSRALHVGWNPAFHPLVPVDEISFPLAVFILFSLCCLIGKNSRGALRNPAWVFLMVSSVACLAIMRAYGVGERMQFLANFCSIFGIAYLVVRNVRRPVGRVGRLAAVASILSMVPIAVHLTCAAKETVRMRDYMPKAVSGITLDPRKNTFEPYPLYRTKSSFCLQLPMQYMPKAVFYTHVYMSGEQDHWDFQFALIPYELRETTPELGTDISGGQGIREAGRVHFISDSLYQARIVEKRGYVEYDFGKGYTYADTEYIEYVSEADGKTYYWLYQHFPWYVENFKTIRGIRFGE